MSSPPPPAPPSNKSSSSSSSSLLLDSRNDRNHSSNRRGRPSSSSNSNNNKKNNKNKNKNKNKNNHKKVVSFATPSIPKQNGHDEKFRNNMIDYKSSAGLLNEDEEDAFDPSVSLSLSTASSRASKKRDVLSLMDDTKHQDDGNEGGGGGGGEEEVDEQYSLFHDEDYAAAAAKNKGSSMSCPIEPFHMKAEREDGMGYFDGDTYIFRKSARRSGRGGMGMVGIDNDGDDNEEEEEDYGEDSWMNQVYVPPRDEFKKARMDDGSSMLFKTNKDNNNNNNNNSDNKHDEQTESLSKNEVYKELAGLLAHDSETVLQALTRYGSLWKRRRRPTKQSGFKKNIDDDNGNNNNKRQKKTMENGSDSIHPTNHDIAKTAFHRLTELSNLCMMKFDNGQEKIIYDWDRQTLMRHVYNHSGGGGGGGVVVMGGDDDCSKKSKSYFHDHHVQQQQQQQQQQVQWEYRGKVDHLIHGPFSTRQMMDWIQAGYFVGSNAVDVRQKKVAEEENGIVGRTGLQQLGIVVKKDNSNVVNDLLGDLEESDDEENDDNEKKEEKEEKHDKEEEMWQRSDQVDFAAYL